MRMNLNEMAARTDTQKRSTDFPVDLVGKSKDFTVFFKDLDIKVMTDMGENLKMNNSELSKEGIALSEETEGFSALTKVFFDDEEATITDFSLPLLEAPAVSSDLKGGLLDETGFFEKISGRLVSEDVSSEFHGVLPDEKDAPQSIQVHVFDLPTSQSDSLEIDARQVSGRNGVFSQVFQSDSEVDSKYNFFFMSQKITVKNSPFAGQKSEQALKVSLVGNVQENAEVQLAGQKSEQSLKVSLDGNVQENAEVQQALKVSSPEYLKSEYQDKSSNLIMRQSLLDFNGMQDFVGLRSFLPKNRESSALSTAMVSKEQSHVLFPYMNGHVVEVKKAEDISLSLYEAAHNVTDSAKTRIPEQQIEQGGLVHGEHDEVFDGWEQYDQRHSDHVSKFSHTSGQRSFSKNLDIRSSAWRQYFTDVVSSMITKGPRNLRMTLHPKNLGSVTVDIALNNSGKLTVLIQPKNEKGRRFFSNESMSLTAAFTSRGIAVSQVRIAEPKTKNDPQEKGIVHIA